MATQEIEFLTFIVCCFAVKLKFGYRNLFTKKINKRFQWIGLVITLLLTYQSIWVLVNFFFSLSYCLLFRNKRSPTQPDQNAPFSGGDFRIVIRKRTLKIRNKILRFKIVKYHEIPKSPLSFHRFFLLELEFYRKAGEPDNTRAVREVGSLSTDTWVKRACEGVSLPCCPLVAAWLTI